MDRPPYLTKLSRHPAALKHNGIYPMLPQEIHQFLDSCNYQAKKKTLRVLAGPSEKRSLGKATEAIRTVILHGARDADSIVAIFNRPNSDIVDLDSMVLPAILLALRWHLFIENSQATTMPVLICHATVPVHSCCLQSESSSILDTKQQGKTPKRICYGVVDSTSC